MDKTTRGKDTDATSAQSVLDLDWERFARVVEQIGQLQRWVSIREVAHLLGTSQTTVKRYADSGDLPAPTRLGSRRCAAAGPDKNGNPRKTQLHRWYLPSLIEHLKAEPRGWGDS